LRDALTCSFSPFGAPLFASFNLIHAAAPSRHPRYHQQAEDLPIAKAAFSEILSSA